MIRCLPFVDVETRDVRISWTPPFNVLFALHNFRVRAENMFTSDLQKDVAVGQSHHEHTNERDTITLERHPRVVFREKTSCSLHNIGALTEA